MDEASDALVGFDELTLEVVDMLRLDVPIDVRGLAEQDGHYLALDLDDVLLLEYAPPGSP